MSSPVCSTTTRTCSDAAGIAYPDDTWTWENLVEAGQALTVDSDGDGTIDQYGLWPTDMELIWASLIWQNEGEILDPEYTKTLLAEEGAMGAWQFIYDMIFDYGMMPTPSAEQFGDPSSRANAP
ncbi:MAG: hypothetical protein R2854_29710 [Caldilineaceae bacterium]